jgi:hypothetical protein
MVIIVERSTIIQTYYEIYNARSLQVVPNDYRLELGPP